MRRQAESSVLLLVPLEVNLVKLANPTLRKAGRNKKWGGPDCGNTEVAWPQVLCMEIQDLGTVSFPADSVSHRDWTEELPSAPC